VRRKRHERILGLRDRRDHVDHIPHLGPQGSRQILSDKNTAVTRFDLVPEKPKKSFTLDLNGILKI